MKNFKIIGLIVLLIPLVSACAVAQRHSKQKSHYEDLTENRLEFPAIKDSVIQKSEVKEIEILPPSHAVTEQVNTILDSIARFNKTRMFVDGFTIQIYSGLKREEAMNAKKMMMDEMKDLVTDLKYEQPKWRLKTGSYYSRLEAQRDLHQLKRIFPNAILVPEKVELK